MVIAQNPESSEYDGMPRSAIATGLVDYVLAPGDMPAQLIAYADRAFALTATPVYVHEGAFDWIRSVVLEPKLSSAHTPANSPLMTARMSETIPCSVSPYPMA